MMPVQMWTFSFVLTSTYESRVMTNHIEGYEITLENSCEGTRNILKCATAQLNRLMLVTISQTARLLNAINTTLPLFGNRHIYSE